VTYLPIEDYGVIGDLHTVALVGINGSIDWFCFPHFDSPSVFGALLDDNKGGSYRIAPVDDGATCKQFYWPETNVLVTRFLSDDGVGDVTDFMPVADENGDGVHQLIRRVRVVRGTLRFRLRCAPAFDYARATHTIERDAHGVSFHTDELSLGLASEVPLEAQDGAAVAEWALREGESATFILRQIEPHAGCGDSLSADAARALFEATVAYWRGWLAGCTYTGRWREMVYRSALVLKLLTFKPTGALVAAPTCSLPEQIGGERNWDYRFTWIRDAAFTLYGLLRIGFTDEAEQFMRWLEGRCFDPRKPMGPLQPIYRIDGSADLREATLDHLAGYRGSSPVRIGNGAAQQVQLDIYGELMDAVYLFNKYGAPISYELWTHLRGILDWLCDNWQRPDEGIWEVRGGQQHFIFSRLMCWVALDRGIRLADKRSFPADRERWRVERDAVYEQIMNEGWSEERQAFIQHYGSDTLDAAALLMPLVFFVSPTDPRMLKTLDAIRQPPDNGGLTSNSLVYRYNTDHGIDGLDGDEGTFSMCSFWLIEALTRAGRFDHERLDQARLMFEQMLTYANHLGLYAEEIGPRGEALGNFPQAFTHLALISAAFNLDRALNES
jgi:GH15 family glucan-1,4-alpha-glucosidase